MEEAMKIFDYLPASYRNPTEKEYIDFLWDAFLTNYQAEKHPFAFLSYHMLFMCFVYFEIWQIRQNCPDDFQKAMVGFNKDIEKELMGSTTPFALWQINESGVFRFLKLIGMDNGDIGKCTKIVKDRNEAAHSNGNIFYKNKTTLDAKISEMLDCIERIQAKSEPIITAAYRDFLDKSSDAENREFLEDNNQITEILVHGNYLSVADIRIAMSFDISVFSGHPYYEGVQALDRTLKELYAEEIEEAGTL